MRKRLTEEERDNATEDYVLGYVDSYGAVHARFVTRGDSHTDQERVAGRPFRFSIFRQEFMVFMPAKERMDEDDILRVEEWLDSMGYLTERKREELDAKYALWARRARGE